MMYSVDVSEVWGIGRKWTKKLRNYGVDTVGQFMNLPDPIVKKMMNVNGLRAKHELLGMYCHHVQLKTKGKKQLASTRSFGKDVIGFEQISEAMYQYIKNGVKKLLENNIDTSKASIFVSGNVHKGEGHYNSIGVSFQSPTQSIEEIWSQVHPQLKKIYSNDKKYKKCGIIFSELTPENEKQLTLFTEPLVDVSVPVNEQKDWEMKSDYITRKYTTSWDELPLVHV